MRKPGVNMCAASHSAQIVSPSIFNAVARLLVLSRFMMMVCAVVLLLGVAIWRLVVRCVLCLSSFTDLLYYSCSVGSARLGISKLVAQRCPSRPTNPARWATRSPAFRCKHSLNIFSVRRSGIRCQKVCNTCTTAYIVKLLLFDWHACQWISIT